MDNDERPFKCSQWRFYFKEYRYPLTLEEYNYEKKQLSDFKKSLKLKKVREKLSQYIKIDTRKKENVL